MKIDFAEIPSTVVYKQVRMPYTFINYQVPLGAEYGI